MTIFHFRLLVTFLTKADTCKNVLDPSIQRSSNPITIRTSHAQEMHLWEENAITAAEVFLVSKKH